VSAVKSAAAAAGLKWRETNYLLLRRGPYLIGAGLDESLPASPRELQGRFVNLFDAELRVRTSVTLAPAARLFLLDLDALKSEQPRVLASACKTVTVKASEAALAVAVEGVADTPAVVLVRSPKAPQSVTLAGQPLKDFESASANHLLWVRFTNESRPRELRIEF
jgi:hypothetical protein